MHNTCMCQGIDCVSVSSFVLLDVRTVRVAWDFVFVFNLNKNVDIDLLRMPCF